MLPLSSSPSSGSRNTAISAAASGGGGGSCVGRGRGEKGSPLRRHAATSSPSKRGAAAAGSSSSPPAPCFVPVAQAAPFSTFTRGRADHGTSVYDAVGTDRYRDVVNDRFNANIQKKWYNFDTAVKLASLERMNLVHSHRIINAKAKVDSSCPRALEILEGDGRLRGMSDKTEAKNEFLRRDRARQAYVWRQQHVEWLREHHEKMNTMRQTQRPSAAFAQPAAVQDYVRNSERELAIALRNDDTNERDGTVHNTCGGGPRGSDVGDAVEVLEADHDLELLALHISKHRGAVPSPSLVAALSPSGVSLKTGGVPLSPSASSLHQHRTASSSLVSPHSSSSPNHHHHSHGGGGGVTESSASKQLFKRHGHLPADMRRELFRSRARNGSAPPSLRGPREAELEWMRRTTEEQRRNDPTPRQIFAEELKAERRAQQRQNTNHMNSVHSNHSGHSAGYSFSPLASSSPHWSATGNSAAGASASPPTPYQRFYQQHPAIVAEAPEAVDQTRTSMSPAWRNKLLEHVNYARGGGVSGGLRAAAAADHNANSPHTTQHGGGAEGVPTSPSDAPPPHMHVPTSTAVPATRSTLCFEAPHPQQQQQQQHQVSSQPPQPMAGPAASAASVVAGGGGGGGPLALDVSAIAAPAAGGVTEGGGGSMPSPSSALSGAVGGGGDISPSPQHQQHSGSFSGGAVGHSAAHHHSGGSNTCKKASPLANYGWTWA